MDERKANEWCQSHEKQRSRGCLDWIVTIVERGSVDKGLNFWKKVTNKFINSRHKWMFQDVKSSSHHKMSQTHVPNQVELTSTRMIVHSLIVNISFLPFYGFLNSHFVKHDAESKMQIDIRWKDRRRRRNKLIELQYQWSDLMNRPMISQNHVVNLFFSFAAVNIPVHFPIDFNIYMSFISAQLKEEVSYSEWSEAHDASEKV